MEETQHITAKVIDHEALHRNEMTGEYECEDQFKSNPVD